MEIGSKTFAITITIGELIKLIPDKVWDKVEHDIMAQASKETGEQFVQIDLYDSEGKLDFGVSTN